METVNMFENLQIVLASTSPRRRDLFSLAGLDFITIASEFEEKLRDDEVADEYVLRNALGKADWVVKSGKLPKIQSGRLYVVVGSDTVVCHQQQILQKPTSEQEAKQMLVRLSATSHVVATGVAFQTSLDGKIWESQSFLKKSSVRFRRLEAQEIDDYVATGEPMDKAGSYGIQGFGASFVESIEGSYTNIMGMPLSQCIERLKNLKGL